MRTVWTLDKNILEKKYIAEKKTLPGNLTILKIMPLYAVNATTILMIQVKTGEKTHAKNRYRISYAYVESNRYAMYPSV